MDRDLILRARNGDHEAFTDLAATAFDQLHRTARLILRSDDLAADAVQEALVSAWLHIRAVRDPDRFDGWLHRLVVRACYREARRNRSDRRIEIRATTLGARPSPMPPARQPTETNSSAASGTSRQSSGQCSSSTTTSG